ncbi:hypothetical protein QBC33DRAFT_172135, partial [Phialemonium atrogriseum]
CLLVSRLPTVTSLLFTTLLLPLPPLLGEHTNLTTVGKSQFVTGKSSLPTKPSFPLPLHHLFNALHSPTTRKLSHHSQALPPLASSPTTRKLSHHSPSHHGQPAGPPRGPDRADLRFGETDLRGREPGHRGREPGPRGRGASLPPGALPQGDGGRDIADEGEHPGTAPQDPVRLAGCYQ